MVFDTHLQWLKPMQKTGIGGNGSQFSLQTGIDRVAPDSSDRIDEKAPCLKCQQDVRKRAKKHLLARPNVSNSTNPSFKLSEDFFCQISLFAHNSA